MAYLGGSAMHVKLCQPPPHSRYGTWASWAGTQI